MQALSQRESLGNEHGRAERMLIIAVSETNAARELSVLVLEEVDWKFDAGYIVVGVVRNFRAHGDVANELSVLDGQNQRVGVVWRAITKCFAVLKIGIGLIRNAARDSLSLGDFVLVAQSHQQRRAQE